MLFTFDDCTLDTQLYTLRRGDREVRLRPKVFEVLMYLLEHRDRVVDKDELCMQVWPRQTISNSTLESTLRTVRQALGDDGRNQRIIATLHGHGYRFVAPVLTSQTAPLDLALAPPSAASSQPAPLHTPAQEHKRRPDMPMAFEAEHRHLTVLFCDLVDAAALPLHLDPETLRAVVSAYHEACTAVVQRFDGYVAQLQNTSILAYFSYPQAHEDDAQRAVHAGLQLLQAVSDIRNRFQDVSVPECATALQIRVGIDTGLVVLDSTKSHHRDAPLALGTIPHIAMRLHGLGAPQTVLLSEATYRLVHGWFTCQALGPQPLPGFPQPLMVYQAIAANTVQDRLEVVSAHGLTPLVGREHEVMLLRKRWTQVLDGHGQVVLLNGEAGIGKSRLVQTLKEYAALTPHVHWECRGSPYHQHSALYPVIDLLQRVLNVQHDDMPLDKLRKLETALAAYDVALPKVVPMLAALLSALVLDPAQSPEAHKQDTMTALLTLLLTLSARYPVLLIVEDLHWVDATTIELLSLLIDQAPTARVGIVLTCRPDFHSPWNTPEHFTQMTLGRLASPEAQHIITRIAGEHVLPAAVQTQIIVTTDGIPLFVEELTKTVLESEWFRAQADRHSDPQAPPLAIPATLHDSLLARLDRLGVAKEVAQLGAVIGRTFSYALLHAVATIEPAVLDQSLTRLVQAGLLQQHGLPPQGTYVFKHALIQQAAYEAMLRSARRQHHQRIAEVLASTFPEVAEMQPELLAYHYTEAGRQAAALPYWQQASQRALERSAYAEAMAHSNAGLTGLKALQESSERLHFGHAFQTTLAVAQQRLGQPIS